jgi:hypothetical protein
MPEVQSVIDAHHHLWDLGCNKYPWLQARPFAPRLEGDIRPIAKNYLLEDYLVDTRKQNVVKSVHVECGWDPSNPGARPSGCNSSPISTDIPTVSLPVRPWMRRTLKRSWRVRSATRTFVAFVTPLIGILTRPRPT